MRRHIFSVAIVAAIALVCAGIYLVERAGTVAPSGQDGTWNSGGSYIQPVQSDAQPQTPQHDDLTPLTEDNTDVQLPTRPVIQGSTATTAQKTPQSSGQSEFSALLDQLRKESGDVPKAAGNYQQLLQAFLKESPTPALSGPGKRTPTQDALYAWGNALGSNIQSFQKINPAAAQTQIVSDQAKNRSDPAKNAALKDLAGRYSALGQAILAIANIPSGAATLNTNLGNAYLGVGTSLAAVAEAGDDKSFLAAITAYNGKADALTGALASIAVYFTTSQVTFQSSDPGAIFGFTGK